MRETLQALARGDAVPIYCGIPTKERLVKRGLAQWRGLRANTRSERGPDAEIKITEMGRALIMGRP